MYLKSEEKHFFYPCSPVAWGHLPNGGTVANLEAMWAARYARGYVRARYPKDFVSSQVS